MTTVDRFTPPAEQIKKLQRWNRDLSLDIGNVEIRNMSDILHSLDCSVASPTLCWTLGTLEETLNAKLRVIRSVYGHARVSVSSNFKTDAARTTLVEGAPEFVAWRLWWGVCSAGASGVEVFDQICQHPVCIGQLGGSDTPYLDIPDLRIKVQSMAEGFGPFPHGQTVGVVKVMVNQAGLEVKLYAAP